MGSLSRGRSLSGGGSLSRGVGIYVQGGLCPGGLCPGGSLSKGEGLCQGDPHPPWTETCENTTLPQTSLAGGNNS